MNYQQQAEEMARKCASDLVCSPLIAQAAILNHIPLAELLKARDRLLALEPGTIEKITDGLWKFAEQECGHNGASAKHALTSITDFVHELQKQNAVLLEVAREAAQQESWKNANDLQYQKTCENADKIQQWKQVAEKLAKALAICDSAVLVSSKKDDEKTFTALKEFNQLKESEQ